VRAADVAKVLGRSPRTVRRWVQAYREGGEAALAARPRRGARPKLSGEQEREVVSWFDKSPREFGIRRDLWTGRIVAELIAKRFGVSFNPRYILAWLARRRIVPIKPRRRPRERDDAEIERWVKEEWPRIQAAAQAQNGHIVFIDESGALLLPLVRRSLAPKGKPAELRYGGKHRQRVSMVAALGLSSHRHHPTLRFRTYRNSYVNQERSAEFLRSVLHDIPGRVIVVWDGGSNHKGDFIRAVLAEHPRLTLERLPPYAPHLNPVEQLWNHLKYQELANYTPADVYELDATLTQKLETARETNPRLKSFVKTALAAQRSLSV